MLIDVGLAWRPEGLLGKAGWRLLKLASGRKRLQLEVLHPVPFDGRVPSLLLVSHHSPPPSSGV